jgi:hypothetical protein
VASWQAAKSASTNRRTRGDERGEGRLTTRRASYIYDPAIVEAAVVSRPHLRAALAELLPGTPCAAFPHARSSPWQLARILGATQDYPRLLGVADDLERSLAHGLKLRWLTTESRAQFRSGLAEVRTACELLRQGFALEDLDDGKGQDRVPELAARRGDLEVAVEVYAPREWQRLADFTDDLAARLRHLDRPFDYTMELSVGRASALDVDGCLTSMHPGPVDAGIEAAAVRNAIVNAIAGGTDTALAEGRPPHATHHVDALNLKVSAQLTRIRRATGPLPERPWTVTRWAAGDYAPEGIFERLMRRRVRHKMQLGQAPGAALPLSMLVVDLSSIELRDEWDCEWYAEQFDAALDAHVARDLKRHDVITLCDASGPDGSLRLRRSFPAKEAPSALVDAVEIIGREVPL